MYLVDCINEERLQEYTRSLRKYDPNGTGACYHVIKNQTRRAFCHRIQRSPLHLLSNFESIFMTPPWLQLPPQLRKLSSVLWRNLAAHTMKYVRLSFTTTASVTGRSTESSSVTQGRRTMMTSGKLYLYNWRENWRIILYYLELAQISANYMTLHFLLNQKGPRKF